MSDVIFEYERANNELRLAERLQVTATTNIVKHCTGIYNKLPTHEQETLLMTNFDDRLLANRITIDRFVSSERDAVTLLRIMQLHKGEVIQ